MAKLKLNLQANLFVIIGALGYNIIKSIEVFVRLGKKHKNYEQGQPLNS